MPKQKYPYYANKPLWQWILIYLVIGGLIYFLIYYFIFAQKGSSKYSGYSDSQPSASSSSKSPYGY